MHDEDDEGEKVYGPYKHGARWRVHIISGRRGARTRSYQTYETEEDANGGIAGARDETQSYTVTMAVDAFIKAKQAKGRAQGTIDSYEDRLDLILGSVKSRPLRHVVNRGAELYAAAQDEKAAATHQNALCVAKMWGRWCVRQKLLKADPFADVEPDGTKVEGADKPRLTVNESRQLAAHCRANADDQGAVLTLAYLVLGARASELVRRDVRDLDDNGRLLWIGKTKTKKGRRRLLIPGELGAMLLRLVDGKASDAPLFTQREGEERMSRFTALKHVRRVCDDAKVTELCPQALRRTQATLATDAGATGLMVAEHLGHESTGVTFRAYIGREAASDAKVERSFKVINGGKA